MFQRFSELLSAGTCFFTLKFTKGHNSVHNEDDVGLLIFCILSDHGSYLNPVSSKYFKGFQGKKFEVPASLMKFNVFIPEPVIEHKKEGHIMISYQWSHQSMLLKIKEELVNNGFKARYPKHPQH